MMTTQDSADSVVTFPEGLPGFEASRRFLLITSPDFAPFTCVHGADPGAPSFLAIDPRRAESAYRCELPAADRARLKAAENTTLLWLALVAPREDGPTVNLRAPLVINPDTMLGLQVVAAESEYPLAAKLREM